MPSPKSPLRSPFVAPLVAMGVACGLGAFSGACGPSMQPAVTLHAPVASASSSASASSKPATVKPLPVPAVALGTFGEGTFGPRVVRGPKGAVVVNAPRSTSGRRWIVTALDKDDRPIADARHEVAEAPEDTTIWDVRAVGDGFVLAWTRPTDAGMQLLTLALVADGAPKGTPVVVTRSGDDLVAVRVVPLGGGDVATAAALLTYGERSLPKGAVVATGALFAVGLDAAGHPLTNTSTKIADRLSAWQVTSLGGGNAIAAFVQRVPEPKAAATNTVGGAQDEVPRAARAVTLSAGGKGVTTSDPVTLTVTDTALPEIDVVSLGSGRALCLFADRRELDAHVFAAALDVSGPKPKLFAPAKRALPPRGDQAIVALVATRDGAVALWETVHPRPTHEARRRFELVRLSRDGEATATPRGVWFPYEDNEPELALVTTDKDQGDDVAILTYGQTCLDKLNGAAPECDPKDLRPFVVRYTGPTLVPQGETMLDVGSVTGGTVLHAFDLSCDKAHCDALVEGPGDPAIVAIAHVPAVAPVGPARWSFADTIPVATTPPRLDTATTLARESQFAGLHATRAGNGTLVGWITYASDDDAEAVAVAPKKAPAKEGKKPIKKGETGARVAVRLLDASGEPMGPVSMVSERGLSKGDIAVAWSALDNGGGVVAYVSRAEGDEEVYVAKVDANGKKIGGSSRITNAPGTASDVALASLPAPEGGYLLAWVDGRKTNAAVYAVRLDKGGAKVGGEVKIGGGVSGDVSDVALALVGVGSSGPKVVAVWSDAREDATTGFGDIYTTTVAAKELGKPSVAEHVLLKTKLHSHNPTVVSRGDGGAVIAWLEDDPSATEMLELSGRPDWGAYFARIDGSGVVVQPPTPIAVDATLGKGVVTGIAADCPSASGCKLVLAWSDREGIALLGAPLSATLSPARAVWSYHGAPTQEVAPALVGSGAYLCEDGLEKDDGRVRRLAIAW
jgi:hypothetical protein